MGAWIILLVLGALRGISAYAPEQSDKWLGPIAHGVRTRITLFMLFISVIASIFYAHILGESMMLGCVAGLAASLFLLALGAAAGYVLTGLLMLLVF